MVVATYFYYEKVRRTMRTAIVSNLLKIIASSIIFRRILTPLVIIYRKNTTLFPPSLENYVLLQNLCY